MRNKVEWSKRFDQPAHPPVKRAESDATRCPSIQDFSDVIPGLGELHCELEAGHHLDKKDPNPDDQAHGVTLAGGFFVGWGPVRRMDWR